LAGFDTRVLSIPIDADPRVAAPLGFYNTARLALKASYEVLNALPRPGNFNGTVLANITNSGFAGKSGAACAAPAFFCLCDTSLAGQASLRRRLVHLS
jgi:hypothetical protein